MTTSILSIHTQRKKNNSCCNVAPTKLVSGDETPGDLMDNGRQQGSLGNWEAARICFQLAVQKLKHETIHLQDDTSIEKYQISTALAELGRCCTQLGLHLEAAQHFETSLLLKRNYYTFESTGNCDSNKNLDLALALECCGNAQLQSQNYPSAKRYFNEALDMKRLIYCKAYQQQEQSRQHDDIDTLQLKQQVYGYDKAQNADLAYSLTKLGQVAAIMGQLHSARKKYTEALTMLQQESSGDHRADIAKLHLLLGNVHMLLHKPQQAAKFLDRAMEMIKVLDARGESHDALSKQMNVDRTGLQQQQQQHNIHVTTPTITNESFIDNSSSQPSERK